MAPFRRFTFVFYASLILFNQYLLARPVLEQFHRGSRRNITCTTDEHSAVLAGSGRLTVGRNANIAGCSSRHDTHYKIKKLVPRNTL